MRDHAVDVLHLDARNIERLLQQGRGVLDRDLLDRPRFGEHPCPWVVLGGVGEAQSAVVRDGGEPDEVDAGLAGGCALDDECRSRVTERQRRQLPAEDVVNVPRRVVPEL